MSSFFSLYQNMGGVTSDTEPAILDQNNHLLNYLLHVDGGFSTDVVDEITKMVSMEQMASVVSTCHEINNADLTLYEAPRQWNDSEDVRRMFRIMTATPNTKWVGRIDTSKVEELKLGHTNQPHVTYQTHVVTDGMLRFVTSDKFPLLTSLDLSYCRHITNASVRALSNKCTQLVSLNLSFCTNTINDNSVIALSNGYPHLVSLNLSGCRSITFNSVFALANGCPLLTTLDLANCNQITDNSLIELSRRCPLLTSLNLTQCKRITDRSVTALSNGCPLLSTLDFYRCDQITDISLVALSIGCKQLKDLTLAHCKRITDRSVLALANGCSQLTKLNLSYCKNFTDAGVLALANGCPKLSTLVLRHCFFLGWNSSYSTFKLSLRESHPQIKIVDSSYSGLSSVDREED